MKSRGLAATLHVALLWACCGGLPLTTTDDRVVLLRSAALDLTARDAAWAEGPFSCAVLVQRKCSALAAPPRVVGTCGAPTPAAPLDALNRTLHYFTCAAAAAAPPAAPSAVGSTTISGSAGGTRGSSAGNRRTVNPSNSRHSPTVKISIAEPS